MGLTDNTLITDDYYMRHPGITTVEDDEMLSQVDRTISLVEFLKLAQELPEKEREELPPEPMPGFFELDPDNLKGLMKSAARISNEFSAHARTFVTLERAKEVRELRCKKKHSWRAVALECHQQWEGSWGPPSNQIMGIELCAAAAEMLGEDRNELPWNDL